MLLGDIQYALRILRKTPGFTTVAVLSLALGIGANSAMFSLADALIFRPLPVPKPNQVVTVSDSAPDLALAPQGYISYPDYVDLRDKNKSFAGLAAAAYTFVGMAEQPAALPHLRLALTVSGNFFETLEVVPALGRTFTADEDRVPGRDAVAVLSYDTWQQRFASGPQRDRPDHPLERCPVHHHWRGVQAVQRHSTGGASGSLSSGDDAAAHFA